MQRYKSALSTKGDCISTAQLVSESVAAINVSPMAQYLENNKHRYHAADVERAIKSVAEQLAGALANGPDPDL